MIKISLGFSGSQNGMSSEQKANFGLYLANHEISEFHHGCCIGSDEQAHHMVVAHSKDIKIVLHPPIENRKRAYFDFWYDIKPVRSYRGRNQAIVDASQVLIATPEGPEDSFPHSGTWMTIRFARAAGIPYHVLAR